MDAIEQLIKLLDEQQKADAEAKVRDAEAKVRDAKEAEAKAIQEKETEDLDKMRRIMGLV